MSMNNYWIPVDEKLPDPDTLIKVRIVRRKRK